jgi:hypothetical protein
MALPLIDGDFTVTWLILAFIPDACLLAFGAGLLSRAFDLV